MAEEKNNIPAGIKEKKVIAEFFGVTTRWIEQLTKEGVIEATLILKDGHRVQMYDFIPTTKRYIKYLSDKASGRVKRTDKEIELREQKMAADIALKESQGELHRLKTQIAAGEYISIEEVKMDYARFFLTFKKFAMSLPARVTGMASGSLDPVEARRIEKELSGEITSLLTSFAVSGVVQPADVKGILDAAKGKKQNDEEVEDEVSGN